MPEEGLPIGSNPIPGSSTTPTTSPKVDLGNISDLYAGGEFRNLHYPTWKVEIRHVKDILKFLELMKTTAENGKEIEKQLTEAKSQLEEAEKKVANDIANKYLTLDANGNVVPTPAGLALVANDPVYQNLPEEDKNAYAVGFIQQKVSGMIVAAKKSGKLTGYQETVKKILDKMAKLQQDSLNSVQSIISPVVDISNKVCSINCDMTDDQMAQADFTFFDPSTEFFDAINQWDMVKISLGWRDADSERYKLGQVFEGIVTNKQGQQSGSATSGTAITATDFKIFMSLTKTKTAYGSDEGTQTSKFIEDMFEQAGLNNDSSNLKPDLTGKNVIYNQTVYDYLNGRAKGLGSKLSSVRQSGVTLFKTLPQEFRDKAFVFAWFENVVSATFTADWPLSDENEKEGDNKAPDPNRKPQPPTDPPPGTGEPPAEMGTGPMGVLAERIEKYMASLKTKNDGRKLNGSLVVRGEPRMTNESLIFLDNFSKGKNGIWKVVSCKHSTSPVFTTSCEIEYLQIPPLQVDLETLSTVHEVLNEGEPKVIKDTDKDGANDTIGPSRTNWLMPEVNRGADPTLNSAQ